MSTITTTTITTHTVIKFIIFLPAIWVYVVNYEIKEYTDIQPAIEFSKILVVSEYIGLLNILIGNFLVLIIVEKKFLLLKYFA